VGRGAGSRVAGGFTLIEILVVALIAVMLIGGALPTSVRRYQRLQAERYARQLRLAAKYARLYAVDTGQTCRLVLDAETRTFSVVVDVSEAEGGPSEAGGQRVLSNPYMRPCRMEDRYQFEQIVITPAGGESAASEESYQQILFRPDGTADTAVVQIGDGVHHYSVTISGATGKAKVQRGTVDEVPAGVVDLDATG